MGCKLLNFYPI